MTVARRVLCGISGAVLVLYVVAVFQTTHMPQRDGLYICCVVWSRFPEPWDTIVCYIVSVAGFYLLSAAAFGDRLRSRSWFLFLLLAHILAAALVGGLHLYLELFPPDPDAWIED